MHELAITQSILEIALRHAQTAGEIRIVGLYLVIGQLSSIVDDSVEFYWDIISQETLAEGAKLHFKRIPAELFCRECQFRYSPDENLTCPRCQSSNIQVMSGDEFYLESIEVMESSLAV